MKIITRAVFQMTPTGYELLEESGFEYEGAVLHAKGGSAPKAPDPAGQANVEAAANRTNTVGPSGSTTWDQGDVEIIGYDSAGNPQYGNRWTETTNLNPSEQHQYDTRNQIAEQLLGSANQRIPEFAGSPFSFDSATPEVAKAQYEKNVALLEPQFKKATDTWEQRMANQGLPVGSEAYTDSQKGLMDSQNDALRTSAYDAITQGNDLSMRERNQNYNELAAALGSSQVQQPGGSPFQPIDTAGAYRQQYEGQLADYNARQAQQSSNTQAAVGLGTAAMMAGAFF